MAKKKTSKQLSPSTVTRMQELGSAWIFKRAIQDSKGWHNWESFTKDPETFNELKKIWMTVGKVEWDDKVDAEWLKSFYKQQKVLLRKIGRPTFTLFTRDGANQPGRDEFPWQKSSDSSQTFMEWVEEYIGTEFKIGNKDNWNPADIWLIQRESHWKEVIKNATKTPKKTKGSMVAQLNQFNQIFRTLFRNKQIMGISLKKIGKGPADYKEVNVTQRYFRKIESASMKLTGVKCYLGTKRINIKEDRDKKSPTFGQMIVDEEAEKRSIRKDLGITGFPTIETQDSWLFIDDPDNDVKYKVQIKNTSTDKMDNLKFEPTEEGKGSARMGKATRAFVFDLMKAYGILNKFPQVHQEYPKTKTAYNRTEMNKTAKKIENIEAKCRSLGMAVITSNDSGEAYNENKLDWGSVDKPAVLGPINIKETMGKKGEAWTANSKLQQISFLNAVLSQPKVDVNKFCTDLIYLAAKQGRGGGFYNSGYGPFGKIY